MRKRRTLLNNENTLLVVTRYPALYSRRVLAYLAKSQNVLVLAQKTKGRKKSYQERKGLTVARVWNYGNNPSLFKIFPFVFKKSRISNILFQFQTNTFGGIVPLFSLPLIFLILKLLGKHIYIELHETLPNNKALLHLYKIIGAQADKIIVLEDELKRSLLAIAQEDKIAILPLILLKKPALPKRKVIKEGLRRVMEAYKSTVSRAYHIPSVRSSP